MQNNAIKVEKSSFEFKGNTCYEYFIGANIRGRDVKIKLGPSDPLDKGGYAVLDIVFGNEDTAEFVVEPFEFQDATGKIITGKRYIVRTTDKETGEIFECAVKPVRNSDKSLLAMLIK